MAEESTAPRPTSGDSFAKAFLPGLILGLVIGGAAGAFLPDLLSSRPTLPTAPAPTGPRPPRDQAPKEEQTPETGDPDKQGPPADEEKSGKVDPSAAPAGTPPQTPPK